MTGKLRFVLVVLIFSSWVSCGAYTPIEDKATLEILNPKLKPAATAKIRLDNGLEAYLVSDPHAEKSGAALSVLVGSWSDPEAYPGIAHFLEHMLFLGTEKYPKESEFDRFVSEHGGLTNAFTVTDYTSFVFTVDNSAFSEGLDRFSQFFKKPLFNPSGVARELQAIDQEYAKNIENDQIRELYVYKELSDPKHPNHEFGMGNSKTLSKVSQDALKEWYRTHYSANLMRLTVISPLPIEELKALVDSDFSDIPNKDFVRTQQKGAILSPEALGHIAFVEPIKDVRTLTLLWDLPEQFSSMRETRPESILCNVIGHEGKESLLAELKRHRLATGLGCGTGRQGPHNTQLYIEVTLTDQGVKKYRDVIGYCFEAINTFKEKGIPDYISKEVRGMAAVRYQYRQRDDAFEELERHASWMAQEEMPTYPEQSNLIRKADPKAVMDLLAFLTPQNCLYSLVAPSKLTEVPPDRKEKWMGVSYAVRPLPRELLAQWQDSLPDHAIELPAPNPYIPENLSLIEAKDQKLSPLAHIPQPEKILDNAHGTVYYATDVSFATPKVACYIEFKTPSILENDPLTVVLGDLYVKWAKEAMNENGYPAMLAELNYDFDRTENGISLLISGYSEKSPILLREIMRLLLASDPAEEAFKVHKATLGREYQNNEKEMPLKQSTELLKSVIYKNFTTNKEKISTLRKVNYERFRSFCASLYNQYYVQALFYGNLSRETADAMAKEVVGTFPGDPYPPADQLVKETIVLPENNGPFFLEDKIQALGNAALMAVEIPEYSFKNRAVQQIANQAMKEPFFATLRTKQQTGYLVFNSAEELNHRLFSLFAVQSNTHDPRDLLARFELFIEGYLQELPLELSSASYDLHKEALINNLKISVTNVKDMGEMLNKIAFELGGDFLWIDKRIEAIQKLTYDEFLEELDAIMGRGNKRRIGILLKGELPDGDFTYRRIPSAAQLRKLSTFSYQKFNFNQ